MVRRDPGKAGRQRPLGFRTFADDTARGDLEPAPRYDERWPEPDYVDPEELAWEAPPALRAAPPEPVGRGARGLWPAFLIGGVAAAALAGAWGYNLWRRGPLPADLRAAPTAAAARPPAGELAVQPATPAPAAAPPQRLETARLAPLAPATPPPVRAGAQARPATAPPPPVAVTGAQPRPQASAPEAPPPAAQPPAAPAVAAPAPLPPPDEAVAPAAAAPAAETLGRSAATLERLAPAPLDCASIRSAAQDIVCRDPGLMAAERRMHRAYAAALAAGAPEPALRADQADWRRIRELAARRSKQAVEDIYHQRIDELETMARQR